MAAAAAEAAAGAAAGAGDDGVGAGAPAATVHKEVIIHPLVLLSAVDHHYRIVRELKTRRVVGVLLGEVRDGRVDVTNSFAVPFEEDARDPTIFFLDHDYLERLYLMFRKVSSKERIVGFYSTWPKVKPCDLQLDALFRRLPYASAHPVLALIDVRPDVEGLPVQAYQTVETVADGKENVRTFVHVACEVGAYEEEEVGVEHLLRDINDPSVSTLAGELRHKLSGLRGLATTLADVAAYLRDVVAGKLPLNNDILSHVQTMLATLPNPSLAEVAGALHESVNDQHLVMFVAALGRSVIALHDVVNNKLKFKDLEDKEAAGAMGAAGADKDKEGKEDGKDGKDGKKEDGKKEEKGKGAK